MFLFPFINISYTSLLLTLKFVISFSSPDLFAWNGTDRCAVKNLLSRGKNKSKWDSPLTRRFVRFRRTRLRIAIDFPPYSCGCEVVRTLKMFVIRIPGEAW